MHGAQLMKDLRVHGNGGWRSLHLDIRRRQVMEHKTILYISDRADRSDLVLAALKETGCEIVTAHSSTEGVALLYVMHAVTAVVLDNRTGEHANFNVAQSL